IDRELAGLGAVPQVQPDSPVIIRLPRELAGVIQPPIESTEVGCRNLTDAGPIPEIERVDESPAGADCTSSETATRVLSPRHLAGAVDLRIAAPHLPGDNL